MNPIESIKGVFTSIRYKAQASLPPADVQNVTPVLNSETREIDMQLARLAQEKAAIAMQQRNVDDILAEAQKRIQAEENAKKAQEFFNKPFEDALSHKSAPESFAVFEEAGLLDELEETVKQESSSVSKEVEGKINTFLQTIKKHKIAASLIALSALVLGGFAIYNRNQKSKTRVAGFDERA